MANDYGEPFVLDFPNGQRVEAILKKAESDYSKSEIDVMMSSKANAANVYSKTEVDTALDGKVDKVPGKGLSTNDYTTADKEKLAGIAEGAEVNEIDSIKVNNTTINPDANKAVNITIPTTAADVSALPDTTRYAAALSLTINSSTFVMTCQLKDQNGDNLGTPQTIDLPLESVVVGGSYDSQTQKVVLTLQNGNTIEFSVADLVSGLQTELSESNKLNPAYIDYDSAHRAVSDAEKTAWNGKQDTTLTGYTVDTSEAGITASSTVTEGIAQLDYRSMRDKSALIELMESGAKNKLLIGTPTTTPSGLTCTQNDDGTYTVSGTLAAAASIVFNIDAIPGYLVLSGCPEGGGDSTYLLRITKSGVQVPNSVDSGSGSGVFTMEGTGYALNIRFAAGTYTNVIFKPMICTKVAWDISQTYQPYAMTCAELTTKEQQNENNISSVLDANGAKNQLDYTLESLKAINSRGTWVNNVYTVNNVKYTVNSDMSITAETIGTPSGSTLLALKSNVANSYVGAILSGCPTGGNNATYNIAIEQSASPYTLLAQDTGLSATIPNNTSGNIIIYVVVKTTLSEPIVFKPMICSADLWAISHQYQPYALSNVELTAKEQVNENNILFNARNGVANVLANTAVTITAANGLTYTVNADKSITVTGNSTAYNAFTVAGSRTYANAMPLKRGTYIIRAGIAYDSSKPIYVQFGTMANSGASIVWQNIYDTNKELAVDNDTTRIVYELYNPSGSYSGYNATFYPMIIDKALYEAGLTDYEPYAMTNAEITAWILAHS